MKNLHPHCKTLAKIIKRCWFGTVGSLDQIHLPHKTILVALLQTGPFNWEKTYLQVLAEEKNQVRSRNHLRQGNRVSAIILHSTKSLECFWEERIDISDSHKLFKDCSSTDRKTDEPRSTLSKPLTSSTTTGIFSRTRFVSLRDAPSCSTEPNLQQNRPSPDPPKEENRPPLKGLFQHCAETFAAYNLVAKPSTPSSSRNSQPEELRNQFFGLAQHCLSVYIPELKAEEHPDEYQDVVLLLLFTFIKTSSRAHQQELRSIMPDSEMDSMEEIIFSKFGITNLWDAIHDMIFVIENFLRSQGLLKEKKQTDEENTHVSPPAASNVETTPASLEIRILNQEQEISDLKNKFLSLEAQILKIQQQQGAQSDEKSTPDDALQSDEGRPSKRPCTEER